MDAVRLRVRSELRRRWRGWVALAVLIGVIGGLVTALSAGARRTETAFERLQGQSAPADLLVLDTALIAPEERVDLDEAADIPGVGRSVAVDALFVLGGRADGRELPTVPLAPFSTVDPALGQSVERKHLLEGRLADPDAADEMVVSYDAARRFDLSPGSVIELEMIEDPDLIPAITALLDGLADRVSGRDPRSIDMAEAGDAVTYRFQVVGVTTSPMDFPPVPGTLAPIVYPTAAFHRESGRHLVAIPILLIQLEAGRSLATYKGDLEALNADRTVVYSGGVDDRKVTVERSVDLQAKGLWFLAALVGLAGLLIVAQLLVRQMSLESDENPVLRALGLTRGQLFAIGAGRAAFIAGAAGLAAVGVAASLSPLFPLGTALAAEPSPGVRLDWPALLAGAVAVAVLAFGTSAAAVRAGLAHQRRAATYGEGSAGVAQRERLLAHGPLTLRLGGRLALDPGRGRTTVPVRSTLAALSVAVGAAALALTVTASLDHLTNTPRLYGWVWDVQVGGVGTPALGEPLTEGLLENPNVDSVAVGAIPQLQVNGVRVDGYALDDVRGGLSVAMLEGRPPSGNEEIALGTATLDDVGASVGDQVEVAIGDRAVSMQVVGRGVFPNLGDAGQLGRGAQLTFAGLERVAPGSARTLALVSFGDRVSAAEGTAAMRRALDAYPVYDDLPPDDLLNLDRSGALTAAITLVLAGVVAATLVHVLVTAARRRRRDLAIVKTLGCSRRQISATVAWQATVLCAAALAVGLPLGVTAGRIAWTLVAHGGGFPAEPVVPKLALAVLATSVLVFGNAVAFGPGWLARRTPPARVLRSE